MLIWDLDRDLYLLPSHCETLHKVRLSLHLELQEQIPGFYSSCILSLARWGLLFFHLLLNSDLKDSYMYGTEGRQSIFQKVDPNFRMSTVEVSSVLQQEIQVRAVWKVPVWDLKVCIMVRNSCLGLVAWFDLVLACFKTWSDWAEPALVVLHLKYIQNSSHL